MTFSIERTIALSGIIGFAAGMTVNRPVLGLATSTLVATATLALDILFGENYARTAALQICTLIVILQKAGRLQNPGAPRQRQRIASFKTSGSCSEG